MSATLAAIAASLAGCAGRPPQPPAPPAAPDHGYAAQGSGRSAPAPPTGAASAMVGWREGHAGPALSIRRSRARRLRLQRTGQLCGAKSAGLQLPRTAQEQLRAGVPIAARELEPGDLVFMRLAHKELHVGIAVGAGRFIHAPASGGRVRIDSLAAPPYADRLLSARRVIGVGAAHPRPLTRFGYTAVSQPSKESA